MVRIHVEQIIAAPPDEVWEDVADLASHVEWMADAETITFLTDRRSGVGTRMRVSTRIGPFRTADVMEFTEWDPPLRMAIRHAGLVTGAGTFTLHASGAAQTRFVWDEELSFPWYAGGPVVARAAAPVLRAVWVRNLRRLAARF